MVWTLSEPSREPSRMAGVRGKVNKGLVDVDVCLCGRLQELDLVLVCEGLALVLRDLALVVHVALVADQDLVHAVARVLLNGPDPVTNVYF